MAAASAGGCGGEAKEAEGKVLCALGKILIAKPWLSRVAGSAYLHKSNTEDIRQHKHHNCSSTSAYNGPEVR